MSEEAFRYLLGEALMADYGQVLERADDSHIFSDNFERKMDKLIHFRRKPYYRFVNTIGKRVACAVAVIIIVSSTTILSVESLREPIFDFFIRMFSDHSNISMESDSQQSGPDTIEDSYEITYDLSDYTAGYENTSKSTKTAYYHKDDIVIFFSQSVIDGYNKNFNTEGSEVEKIQINGYDAIVYFDNHGWYSIVWNNGEYVFHITSNVGKDILIEVAKSVQNVE